jgi:APA family basic amino acid/polyamine antiporter
MLGVLLNLILGLSRVALAMGRRGDMPVALARLNRAGITPTWAVWAVGVAISVLTLLGNVQLTWSFSAFTVLIYYALTNAAALRLLTSQRIFPTWVAWAGLAACLFLAFWVEPVIWLAGLGCIGLGLIWHAVARALYRPAM